MTKGLAIPAAHGGTSRPFGYPCGWSVYAAERVFTHSLVGQPIAVRNVPVAVDRRADLSRVYRADDPGIALVAANRGHR